MFNIPYLNWVRKAKKVSSDINRIPDVLQPHPTFLHRSSFRLITLSRVAVAVVAAVFNIQTTDPD